MSDLTFGQWVSKFAGVIEIDAEAAWKYQQTVIDKLREELRGRAKPSVIHLGTASPRRKWANCGAKADWVNDSIIPAQVNCVECIRGYLARYQHVLDGKEWNRYAPKKLSKWVERLKELQEVRDGRE